MKGGDKNQIEIYVEWYLQDLKDNGFVKDYSYEPITFTVCETEEYGRLKRYKTKAKIVESFNLFAALHYTPDYEIIWTEKAEFLFYETINPTGVFQFGKPVFVAHKEQRDDQEVIVSYIDVKPTNAVARRGGHVSSSLSFTYKKRMLWDNHRIYVNKCVPIPMSGTGHTIALFCTTFTPVRYLWTDKATKLRKINFPITDIKGYVLKKTAMLSNALNKYIDSQSNAKNKNTSGKGTSQKTKTNEKLQSNKNRF